MIKRMFCVSFLLSGNVLFAAESNASELSVFTKDPVEKAYGWYMGWKNPICLSPEDRVFYVVPCGKMYNHYRNTLNESQKQQLDQKIAAFHASQKSLNPEEKGGND
jgi:hypothetical protein